MNRPGVAKTRLDGGGGSQLRLREVTVVAADCVRPDLAGRALALSMQRCRFADAILFTDTPVDGPFRCEQIAPLRSVADYSRFCLQEMPARIPRGSSSSCNGTAT
jgi:hypothetical protein